MLYETFNHLKKAHGKDFFVSRLDDDVVRNLNPKFELREYQKEALGRVDFYFDGYQERQHPAQLLFHMATGSGKTLIMAANILQLYKQGYRNFIFFVNSTNIIEKTKDNFLNKLSSKYLFADRIKFGEKEIQIREADNFEAASPEDINIVFTTIQGLHTRLNYPKENALTYEEFEGKDVVLISDEAHHINTLTKLKRDESRQRSLSVGANNNSELDKLNKAEREEVRSWERTVERIFRINSKNILLEFTATINEKHPAIKEKYEDKIIFQYDLKQFRLDGYSKEIEVLETDMEPIDRALQAVIASQYRRKIAEKNGLFLKPVVLFKANYVNKPARENPNAVVSSEFKNQFIEKIKNLRSEDILKFKNSRSEIIQKAFEYFEEQDISIDNLILEIKNDFDKTKCLSIDSNEEKEKNQVLVNTLEAKDNEIRAVFAVEMLNEGWDVLNLFDIIRLYNTRDARANRPGPTTIAEAQLIGRGARYCPFTISEEQSPYVRKFDGDRENELRFLEQLHYHSAHNPRYIQELKTALTEIGIMPEKYIDVELRFKDSFKRSDFWKKGIVFANERIKNPRRDVFSFEDAKITKEHTYEFPTGETWEAELLNNSAGKNLGNTQSRKRYKLSDFGGNIIRSAMDYLDFYRFDVLKEYFPHIESRKEFIFSSEYLGGVSVEVFGRLPEIENLSQKNKFIAAIAVLKRIEEEARRNTAEYVGEKTFKPYQMKEVFHDKIIKIAEDDDRAKGASQLNLIAKDWYAQNELYGTSEEENLVDFLDSVMQDLKKKYKEVALLRNERELFIFDFDEGRRFEPDFLLMLKSAKQKKVLIQQVFIESKGNQFKDNTGGFELSGEGWKQKFLLELKEKAKIAYEAENRKFRLLGLPFYNKDLQDVFEEAFEEEVLF